MADSSLRLVLDTNRRDQNFIELALQLRATHIISDDADLRRLTQSRTDAGRRFRQRLPLVQIVTAGGLLEMHEDLPEVD